MMRHKVISNVLLCIGGLLILSGAVLYAHNYRESNRAYELGIKQVAGIKEQIEERTATESSAVSDEIMQETVPAGEDKPKQLPVVIIDGYPYCGYLSIPKIGLEMPVTDGATAENMHYSLSRYAGDPYQQNMIIAGHNYRAAFLNLRDLEAGDEIYFTDMDGEVFRYRVLESIIIPGDAVSAMEEGEWDLTLFTCTYGGADRFTVRCAEE